MGKRHPRLSKLLSGHLIRGQVSYVLHDSDDLTLIRMLAITRFREFQGQVIYHQI